METIRFSGEIKVGDTFIDSLNRIQRIEKIVGNNGTYQLFSIDDENLPMLYTKIIDRDGNILPLNWNNDNNYVFISELLKYKWKKIETLKTVEI